MASQQKQLEPLLMEKMEKKHRSRQEWLMKEAEMDRLIQLEEEEEEKAARATIRRYGLDRSVKFLRDAKEAMDE